MSIVGPRTERIKTNIMAIDPEDGCSNEAERANQDNHVFKLKKNL